MSTIKLYNTELGELADYKVSIDRNGEIVCLHEESTDAIKFPGGLTKAQFDRLVKKHNDANKGIVALDTSAIEARDKKNEALLDSLS